MVPMMSDLLAETDKIIQGAAEGHLKIRADASKFEGGWNQLVAGINGTLDAVIDPINEAAVVLELYGK